MASKLTVEGNRILLPNPLLQAQLVGRPSRFIVLADLEEQVVDAHCSLPGTLGGLVVDGLPCLLSGPYDKTKRSTPYSLEAFSPWHPDDGAFQWVGVNQGAANNYVEAALRAGWLDSMVKPQLIEREKKLGSSRIDFLLDGTVFLEVKMPVDNLQLDPPPALPRHWPVASKVIGRADRQALDLTAHLKTGQRAIFLRVFCYDNDGTWRAWPYRQGKDAVAGGEGARVHPGAQIFADARSAGLESWELSFKMEPTHLEFLRLKRVS